MLLSELKDILNKAETLGFSDEEVEVIFKNSFTTARMKIVDNSLTVKASERKVAPKLYFFMDSE